MTSPTDGVVDAGYCSGEEVKQELDGENSDFRNRLSHRRQSRHDEVGERNVVKADNREVARHGEFSRRRLAAADACWSELAKIALGRGETSISRRVAA